MDNNLETENREDALAISCARKMVNQYAVHLSQEDVDVIQSILDDSDAEDDLEVLEEH